MGKSAGRAKARAEKSVGQQRCKAVDKMKPRLYILAGANGSGKSTISKVFLPAEGVVYINPDDISSCDGSAKRQWFWNCRIFR